MRVYVVIRQPDLDWDFTADLIGVFSTRQQAEAVRGAEQGVIIAETDLLTGSRARLRGVIRSIKAEMGYGFIRTLEGDNSDMEFFFHRTALQNVRLEELTVGTPVTFEVGIGQKGPRAEQVYV